MNEWRTRKSAEFLKREIVIDVGDGSPSRIPVPDGEIVCDSCNAEVMEEPFVVVGTDALCRSCREERGIERPTFRVLEWPEKGSAKRWKADGGAGWWVVIERPTGLTPVAGPFRTEAEVPCD